MYRRPRGLPTDHAFVNRCRQALRGNGWIIHPFGAQRFDRVVCEAQT